MEIPREKRPRVFEVDDHQSEEVPGELEMQIIIVPAEDPEEVRKRDNVYKTGRQYKGPKKYQGFS